MSVDGQSRYSLQPFIDYTGVPIDADGNYEYQPFHAHAMSLLGFVTIDWTNFFHGYEAGKRKRLHWFTPIGLGASMLFGEQKNPKGSYDLGDFRRNFELAYSFRIGAECREFLTVGEKQKFRRLPYQILEFIFREQFI
jgi:hypothetical protein